ncbi:hypothetical protein BABINDRAFT_166521 [Babjeviella inositovora NRRL Y-12698]|uniref:Septin-type G domain-containing protein n=1 Tax=Babjeviella inositovora NRRL Y-12698 TaxID=984486 RepID=A0A1E3QR49_9ASCO|nr:uncharacterized protein BABINDRAFT_166521 [Babjeviella inositovora NRRL Y-12698]ODQ80151.1 hypothetical protein BABINDRAFT_166521 [Babjeviella inositovora NRRL Y-12698]
MAPVSIPASPEEMRHRKMVKRGLKLCFMVCGERGTGKSTFINTLCDQVIEPPLSEGTHGSWESPGLEIYTQIVDVVEKGSTPISLQIVRTPGLGDNLDNTECPTKILEYLERQFDDILSEECRIRRNPRSLDNRVHVVLYFIRPTGKGLREIDILTMKVLSKSANVIPLLSKADLLTDEELKLNKVHAMQDIATHGIPIYDFASDIDDADSFEEARELQSLLPFAIVSSKTKRVIDGKEYHVREYPWGTVKVEDPSQSDFVALKTVLFGSHMQEFKDVTHSYLYEKYRTNKLSTGGGVPSVKADNPKTGDI